MDLHFYVRRNDDEYKVGRMLCPVVPRISETVNLRMSLMAKADITWRLNPASPIHFDTAYFLVEDIAYDGYNCEDIEEGMGAAPYREGSTAYMVRVYVKANNADTQAYIDRITNAG